MRQRKATAYPQVGALVQPRPGDCHPSTARHAMRMTPKASRVKQRKAGLAPFARETASRETVRADGWGRVGPLLDVNAARAAWSPSNFRKLFDGQAARAQFSGQLTDQLNHLMNESHHPW